MRTTFRGADRQGFSPWLTTVLFLVAMVTLYYVLPMRGPWWPISAIAGPLAVVALVPLTKRQTRRILASEQPIADVARALAVLFVVIVLGFASTYYAIDIHAPSQIVGIETKTDSLYFTVTVLSTVGFGDIHPVGEFARVITTIDMVTNLVAVAVSVRLVTWAGKRRVDEASGGRGPF